ncbi:MAG: hypothetical protein ABJF88_05605 [Rhodothermales bacterium]
MPRPPLTVLLGPNSYLVHDPGVAELFGTDTLPLPFTPDADPDTVLAHLRRINPHRLVLLGDPVLPSSPRPSPPHPHPPIPSHP